MPEAIASPLSVWESFYVIVGSSAAALTGLMFVVIALIAEGGTRTSSPQIGAFGTPTIVHFCFALLVSAILSAPWGGLADAGLALGICGATGFIYSAIVVRRARRQTNYQPVLEDWLCHAFLPLLAYLDVAVAGIALRDHPQPALFAIGGGTVLLVFIGIHNAWDSVTYVTIERVKRESGKQE